LTLPLVGGEWSASPSCVTPGERIPGTHWYGGWVGLRVGMDAVEKRIFLTLPRLELHPSIVQPIASVYILISRKENEVTH
jgi:hypothetical protein